MEFFVIKRVGIYELRDKDVLGVFDSKEKAIDYAKELKVLDVNSGYDSYHFEVLKFTLNEKLPAYSDEEIVFSTDK